MGAKAITDCRQVDENLDRLFRDPAGELPDEVRAHIADCPRCRGLHRLIVEGDGGQTAGADLLERLNRRGGADLLPVKPLPSNRVLAMRFLGVFAAGMLVFLGWMGVGGFQAMTTLQLAVVSLVLLVGAALLAMSLSWQMAPGERQRIPAPLLICTLLAGFLMVVAALFPWNASLVLKTGWSCTWAGLLVAVPTAFMLLYLASRGAPLAYPKLGASLGAAAGLLGLAVLQYHCPQQEASHIMLWHGLIVVISVGVGYGLGRSAQQVVKRVRG